MRICSAIEGTEPAHSIRRERAFVERRSIQADGSDLREPIDGRPAHCSSMRTIVTTFCVCVTSILAGCAGDAVVIGDGNHVEPDGQGGGDTDGDIPPYDPRLDILVVVDNSINMAEKQERFADELEQLLLWLAEPPCMSDGGAIVAPVEPGGSCPEGTERKFAPIKDLHLGVISSSLGDLGSGACASEFVPNTDDRAHLVTRSPDGQPVPVYQDLGFLAFDPDGAMSPPGEASIVEVLQQAKRLVIGAGDSGCGYEMPLEAMTRFLVDPLPYDALVADDLGVHGVDVDQALLDQRGAFLRSRSNLAVIVLSDENDCSIAVPSMANGLFAPGPFFRATSVCQASPNDPCCTSCGIPTPAGCAPDPSCEDMPRYSHEEDHQNLKCWDQKRRYGVDFRFPMERYVNALSAVQIDPSQPSFVGVNLVDNPLFAEGRHPSQVSMLVVGGLPWQDTVQDPSDAASPTRTAEQLSAAGAWDWLTGSVPGDPFVRESVASRTGSNPATAEDVASANAINGGDRTIPLPYDGLQYACTFDLTEPADPGLCVECTDASCDNPICDGTLQIAASAYPARRQLEVARGLGDRGAIGSVCRDPSFNGSAQSLLARLADVLQ